MNYGVAVDQLCILKHKICLFIAKERDYANVRFFVDSAVNSFKISTTIKPSKFLPGLTVGVTVLEGTYAKMYGEVQAAKLSLRQTINEEGVKGFPDVVASNNISDGICHL